jgi:hypothetical protein
MSEPKERSKADVKADLAALGATVKADAVVTSVAPPKPGEGAAIIVLDRVADNKEPDYCCHGYAQCVRCYEYCWLGHMSEKVVTSGQAYPVCMPCATLLAKEQGLEHVPRGHVYDHKRADGPHDD